MRIIGNGYQLWMVSDNDVAYDSQYVAYGLVEAKFLNMSLKCLFSLTGGWMTGENQVGNIKSVTTVVSLPKWCCVLPIWKLRYFLVCIQFLAVGLKSKPCPVGLCCCVWNNEYARVFKFHASNNSVLVSYRYINEPVLPIWYFDSYRNDSAC